MKQSINKFKPILTIPNNLLDHTAFHFQNLIGENNEKKEYNIFEKAGKKNHFKHIITKILKVGSI